MASQIPGAKVVRLPESPDYPPEWSHPERNLAAARAFIAGSYLNMKFAR